MSFFLIFHLVSCCFPPCRTHPTKRAGKKSNFSYCTQPIKSTCPLQPFQKDATKVEWQNVQMPLNFKFVFLKNQFPIADLKTAIPHSKYFKIIWYITWTSQCQGVSKCLGTSNSCDNLWCHIINLNATPKPVVLATERVGAVCHIASGCSHGTGLDDLKQTESVGGGNCYWWLTLLSNMDMI